MSAEECRQSQHFRREGGGEIRRQRTRAHAAKTHKAAYKV